MNKHIGSILKVLVFTTLGLGILYLLYKNQSAQYLLECQEKGIPDAECSLIDKLITDFKSVKIIWIVVLLIIFMLSNVFRALRWNQMLRSIDLNPRFVNSLGAIMIGYFTNLGVPRIGEFIKVGIVCKYDNMPFDKVMGTIVLDRIVDLLFFALFIALGFFISFDLFSNYFEENLSYSTGQILGFLGLLALLGLASLFFAYKFIYSKITEASSPILIKIKNVVDGFLTGLQSVFKLESQISFWLYSLGIWICYYLMTYFCFFAFQPTAHLGLKEALIVFVFGTLGMVIPTPGGVGSYQFLVHKSLVLLGVAGIAAFSFANIMFFSISILCNIIFGLLFLVLLPLYNTKT